MSFSCVPDIGVNDLGVKLREAKYFMIAVLVDLCALCEKLGNSRGKS